MIFSLPEAANHYYFSKGQIAEKIINCNYIIDSYSKKIKNIGDLL
jgi:predicted DNA-binding protein YlxM (UPF0122 family)